MYKAAIRQRRPVEAPTIPTEGESVKYLLLIRPDHDYPDGVPDETIRKTEAWVADVKARGVHLTGGALQPPAQSTGVRRSGAKVVTTDGPFAESKEQMGGFDLIECDTLEEAIEIAAGHPVTEVGMVEVRPMVEELRSLGRQAVADRTP
jgi:hypothetical protein